MYLEKYPSKINEDLPQQKIIISAQILHLSQITNSELIILTVIWVLWRASVVLVQNCIQLEQGHIPYETFPKGTRI